jgi:L-lactate dehydrogenase complex protein LldG
VRESDARESILRRIREALARPSARAGLGDEPLPGDEARPGGTGWRAFLPPAGSTHEERVRLFGEHSEALRTEFVTVEGPVEMAERVREIARREGWSRVASHRGRLTDTACAAIDAPVLRTDEGYDIDELERCDAGITECEALVAQTGSVLVTARSSGGRALSVLPPHHVVLATREQLVGDLADAYEGLRERYGDDAPSLVSFVTGPSRTGDIERILVLGAHGPRKLTVVIAES